MAHHEIEEIEGLDALECEQLRAVCIADTDALLMACRTPRDRSRIAHETGLGDRLVLRCAQTADLLRVPGVGPAHAKLLERIGIDTVWDLRSLDPALLTTRMREANEAQRVVRAVPSRDLVTSWILDACRLPGIIEY